ncbi:hypothetical protein OFO01_00505 [Campylobacter sp. JMF_01 NE2]|nr:MULTISPECIES: hypothetical protein [unclassified Campylobacter]MDA3048233.1 hypothetical protein [Campylobacter sp. JMF_08 NE1]MDA3048860.1 hypothetical protein [Campylobacter sp. JMF_15 NE4]MDA3050429.1 hypothetical protein [Campylobacter sp. JMF_02 ED1]MDA3051935.1 hypothetical protein [Campylobacter sp. JMF_03 NE3]MDA3055022.1 hypothetical protein [Campylobacter sp. VBCF_07 NA4]
MIHLLMMTAFVLFMAFLVIGFNKQMIEKNNKRNQEKEEKNEITY